MKFSHAHTWRIYRAPAAHTRVSLLQFITLSICYTVFYLIFFFFCKRFKQMICFAVLRPQSNFCITNRFMLKNWLTKIFRRTIFVFASFFLFFFNIYVQLNDTHIPSHMHTVNLCAVSCVLVREELALTTHATFICTKYLVRLRCCWASWMSRASSCNLKKKTTHTKLHTIQMMQFSAGKSQLNGFDSSLPRERARLFSGGGHKFHLPSEKCTHEPHFPTGFLARRWAFPRFNWLFTWIQLQLFELHMCKTIQRYVRGLCCCCAAFFILFFFFIVFCSVFFLLFSPHICVSIYMYPMKCYTLSLLASLIFGSSVRLQVFLPSKICRHWSFHWNCCVFRTSPSLCRHGSLSAEPPR